MKPYVRRLVATLCVLLLSASVAVAKSPETFYKEGIQLQKTRTVKAQNSAIAKFTSAKKLFDSDAKKALCDQAISKSRKIISELKKPGPAKDDTPRKRHRDGGKTPAEKPAVTLTLSNQSFEGVDRAGTKLKVGVNASRNDWTLMTILAPDGSSPFKAHRVGNDAVEITVPSNPGSLERKQSFEVCLDTITRRITVVQEGRKVNLSASSQVINLKRDKAAKEAEIWSDCEVTYADNNDANWHVVERPDWARVSIKNDKKKRETDGALIKTKIIITAIPQHKGAPERMGIIIIESGNSRLEISVNQDAGRN